MEQLEEYYVAMTPQSDRGRLERARAQGKSPYLAIRLLGETERSIRVPGEWLTEWKKVKWPENKD